MLRSEDGVADDAAADAAEELGEVVAEEDDGLEVEPRAGRFSKGPLRQYMGRLSVVREGAAKGACVSNSLGASGFSSSLVHALCLIPIRLLFADLVIALCLYSLNC